MNKIILPIPFDEAKLSPVFQSIDWQNWRQNPDACAAMCELLTNAAYFAVEKGDEKMGKIFMRTTGFSFEQMAEIANGTKVLKIAHESPATA